MISCTQFKQKKLIPMDKEIISRSFHGFCSEHSGKGAIEFQDKKFQFHYENLFDSINKKWLKAIEIPLKGDEDLRISWSNNKFRYSGSFYRRLKIGFLQWGKSKGLAKQDFKNFLKLIIETQIIAENLKKLSDKEKAHIFKSCEDQITCSYEKEKFKVVQTGYDISFSKRIKTYSFLMKFSQFNSEGKFKFYSIKLNEGEEALFSLRLIPSHCEDGHEADLALVSK